MTKDQMYIYIFFHFVREIVDERKIISWHCSIDMINKSIDLHRFKHCL